MTAAALRRGLDRADLSILAVFGLQALAFGSWLPRLPELKEAFGLSDRGLGLVLLGVPAGALVALPLAGWLSTRTSPRALNLGCMAGMVACIAAIATAPSAPGLALVLVTVGLTGAAMDLAMNVAGFAVEERRGRPILSKCHALFSVGMAAAGLVGGAMVWAGVPIALHLTLVGGAVLAAFLAALPGLPSDAPPRARGEPQFAWPSGALVIPAAILFFGLMAEGAMQDWSAVFLADVLLADGAAVGLGLTVFAGSMAAVRFSGDRLAERFGPALLLAASGAVACVGLSLLSGAPNPGTALAGFAVTGAGIAVVAPVTFRLAGRLSPRAPGVGVAAVAAPGYLGFLLGPPLMGLLAEIGGLRLSFAMLAVAMAIVAGLARRTRS